MNSLVRKHSWGAGPDCTNLTSHPLLRRSAGGHRNAAPGHHHPRRAELTVLPLGDQSRQALVDCHAILQAAGAGLEDVVEVDVLISAPDDVAGLNEEYARWFSTNPPTRYVAQLGIDALPGLSSGTPRPAR